MGGCILGYFASYTGTLRSASMSLADQTLVELGADTLLAQGHANFRFVLADGRETDSALRTTWVLVRRLGVWQAAYCERFSETVRGTVYSSSPSTPFSMPTPDCLWPAMGLWGPRV